MRWWKIIGLAAFAGVAATGIVIARAERQRRATTPEEIRERLHARLAEASAIPSAPSGNSGPPDTLSCPPDPPGRIPAGHLVLPEQSREDTDADWGDYPGQDDERLRREQPPHWDDA